MDLITRQCRKRTVRNNNTKLRSFKSEENILKKDVGPYH